MNRARRKPGQAAAVHAAQHEVAVGDSRSRAELIHELEVHQVELEMQNDELRHAQVDLAAARDRFVDLYDFAPVGYFTLDARGLVREANLTGAAMLACDRKALLGRGFSRFVASTHVYIWHDELRQALQTQHARRVELELLRNNGESFSGQLDCMSIGPSGASHALRVALTDISARKLAETDRRIAVDALDAREDERRHVARELHEELGQRLSALKMELGSLDQSAAPHVYGQRVRAMLDSLDQAVASVRRIAIDLRPPMLDDLGLGAAIEWLAQDASRRLGLDIRLDLEDIYPAPDDRVAIAAYRMAQELLHHVARHAHGCKTTFTLAREPAHLVLTVNCQSGKPVVARGEAAVDQLTPTLLDRAHMLGVALVAGGTDKRVPSITARIPLLRAAAHASGDARVDSARPESARQVQGNAR